MSEKPAVELLSEIVALKEGGEVRTQQAEAVGKIEECLNKSYHLILEAPTGSGKALDINTPILTSNGWSTMGELKAGDKVFDERGKITNIIEAHPIQYDKRCFQVTFSDGSKIIADAEHLWATNTLDNRENVSLETSSIYTQSFVNNLKQKIAEESVEPVTSSIDISQLFQIPLDLVERAANKAVHVETLAGKPYYESVSLFESIYLEIANSSKEQINGFNVKIVSTQDIFDTQKVSGYVNHAVPVSAPVDFGTSSNRTDAYQAGVYLKNNIHNHQISEEFLYGSIESRMQFLDGMVNGELSANRNYEFYASNEKLSRDVYQLIVSLGFQARMRHRFTDTLESFYIINFSTSVDMKTRLRYIVEVVEVESRPVRCISVDSPSHLFLAGESLIPTHNTLSYLIPVINSGKKVVVSTATKQLSEQIMDVDVPFLRKALKQVAPDKQFSSSLLKGRDNYYCLKKSNDIALLSGDKNAQLPGFEGSSKISLEGAKMAKEIKLLDAWSEKTFSGDRSEAPAVNDKVWRQYSSNNSECPGKNVCPFGQECFAELARDKAKYVDIVVTNHAVVAQDIANPESGLLGEREVFVFDELHELDGYMTDAWGNKLSSNMLKDANKLYRMVDGVGDEYIASVEKAAKQLDQLLNLLDDGLMDDMPYQIEDLLKVVQRVSLQVFTLASKMVNDKNLPAPTLNTLMQAKKKSEEVGEACSLLLNSSIENVRWLTTVENVKFLNAAPLRIGPKLQAGLEQKDAIMIGTSATITVAGSFEIPLHNLGFDRVENVEMLQLDSPFDFDKQAMMFIPAEDSFPAPVGADRKDHTEAVKAMSRELIAASSGHALVLCTTTYAAKQLGEYLRTNLPRLNVLIQGEKPNPQLVEEFKADAGSVLVATMGMWHGLDVQGIACSLVIIDKIPFKPMDDPLSLARQRYAESNGRNGFMDVYVADANVMLAQGVGRLIRSRSDRGVVAILDTRLTSKPYGRKMLQSLPKMRIFRDKKQVVGALERLVASFTKDAGE